MKQKILIIAAILVIIAVTGFFAITSLSSQNDVKIESLEGGVTKVPISGTPLFADIAPGLSFKIDTGCDFSSLTAEDRAKLEAMGYDVRESLYPVVGRDGFGDKKVALKRYTVDLPIYNFTVKTDSTGRFMGHEPGDRLVSVIRNVDFVDSESGFSVLGIDFLEKFVVEYRYGEQSIAFLYKLPEAYVDSIPMLVANNPAEAIWLGNRYYMSFSVDHRPHDFMVDTGLHRVKVKQPRDDAKWSKHKLAKTTAKSYRGQYECLVDDKAWLEAGNRAGSYEVSYYDNDEENYAVNPLTMFRQDAAIDFGGLKVCLKATNGEVTARLTR